MVCILIQPLVQQYTVKYLTAKLYTNYSQQFIQPTAERWSQGVNALFKRTYLAREFTLSLL